LIYLLDNNVDDLNLTFTWENDTLEGKESIELVPNGANIAVTEKNKKDFVKAVAYWKMTIEIRD
jgi:hypothetical protein